MVLFRKDITVLNTTCVKIWIYIYLLQTILQIPSKISNPPQSYLIFTDYRQPYLQQACIYCEKSFQQFKWSFVLFSSLGRFVKQNQKVCKWKKQPPEVFYKKGVLRNFPKFTGKHLCQSLFFDKVAGLRP